MLLAVAILLCAGILYFACWCLEYKRKFRCLNHIPGPKTLPILGNVLEIGRNYVEKLTYIHGLHEKYGPITRMWIGPNKFYLLLADPEMTEFFISSPKFLTKSEDYIHLTPWLRNGLLVSTGNYWQKRRKVITPAFHFKILEEFIPVFHLEAKKLVKRLEKFMDKDVFDIYPYIQAYTLDVICETAMGTSVNAQSDLSNKYVEAIQTVTNLFMERIFSVWKQFDALYELSDEYCKQTMALNIIHEFSKSVIEKRREALLVFNESKKVKKDGTGQKVRAIFLDVLLQSTIDGKPLTNDDICEEVDTFMFEGHDTTAAGLGFALYEISRNPDVQNKIVDELKSIFHEDMYRDPTLQDLNNMKYLEAVIKETMRLYPPVPLIGRSLDEDVYYNSQRFPKGMIVLVSLYSMHRWENLFEKAKKFIPERFIHETMIKRNLFSYIPFSAGPRNCVGQKFAMYEMKSAICEVLRNFDVQPATCENDLILAAKMILKSENGLRLKLKRRTF